VGLYVLAVSNISLSDHNSNIILACSCDPNLTLALTLPPILTLKLNPNYSPV